LKVSKSVVDLRDVLADGRMFLPDASGARILIKFGKPCAGKTCVTFRAIVREWVDQAIQDVSAETKRRNARRCLATTVSGLTRTKESFQPLQ
jgi:hypothetical protein